MDEVNKRLNQLIQTTTTTGRKKTTEAIKEVLNEVIQTRAVIGHKKTIETLKEARCQPNEVAPVIKAIRQVFGVNQSRYLKVVRCNGDNYDALCTFIFFMSVHFHMPPKELSALTGKSESNISRSVYYINNLSDKYKQQAELIKKVKQVKDLIFNNNENKE